MNTASLRRMRGLIRKEMAQVVRDPSSILIAFVLPAVLLFLFGYGVSLDAYHVRIGVVLENTTPEAQSLAVAFKNSRYFETRIGRDRRQFEEDLVAGELRGMVVVPATFTETLRSDDASTAIQVIADGSEPNTSNFVHNYVQGVFSNWLIQQSFDAGRPEAVAPRVAIETRVWFNPELQSRWFLLPGSIAIIMTIIGTLLTALVVAREWERGTMEALMATPISIAELLVGKLTPYYLLGMGSMGVCVLASVTIFDLPFRGSVLALVLVSSIFLIAMLALGLLISTVSKNQFVASQIALVVGFLPSFLLSGFVFEIGSMPFPIQNLTRIIPARYFVTCLQTIFLAGDIPSVLLPNTAALAIIATVLMVLVARKTNKRLD
ncbi:MAG: ABC-2 type transport system permease protein [Verrucomicrobiales bacterium]|jgi:ABC-2 type transport system permease protein